MNASAPKLLLVDAERSLDLWSDGHSIVSASYGFGALLKQTIDTQDIKVVFVLPTTNRLKDAEHIDQQKQKLQIQFGENNFISKKCDVQICGTYSVFEADFWQGLAKKHDTAFENACVITSGVEALPVAKLANMNVIHVAQHGQQDAVAQNKQKLTDFLKGALLA